MSEAKMKTEIIYLVNGCVCSRVQTEFFFGKNYTAKKTGEAIRRKRVSNIGSSSFFQEGTGYLTVVVE